MPAFKLKYPTGCFKNELDPKLPHQVMSMRTLHRIQFAAYVVDAANNIGLKDFGPNYYVPGLKDFSPNFSDIKIVSNKEIVLKGNTAAYRLEIKCKYKVWPINLVVVAAQRQNKYVYVAAGGWAGRSLEDGVKIAESLTFE